MKKLTRKSLNINGVERHVVCDPENDSLATILRQMGLTGTKIGCNTGFVGLAPYWLMVKWLDHVS